MLDLLNIGIALGDARPGADVTVSGETLRLMLLDLEGLEEATEEAGRADALEDDVERLTDEVTQFRGAAWAALTALRKALSKKPEGATPQEALTILEELFS